MATKDIGAGKKNVSVTLTEQEKNLLEKLAANREWVDQNIAGQPCESLLIQKLILKSLLKNQADLLSQFF